MDINAILDNNGYDVTNPNYNPNTKKGKLESPTLKTENIGEVHPFITSAYEKNKTDAFMFNVNDYEKENDIIYYFKNPLIICCCASCSVNPNVINLINCSPAILPIAAS